MAHGHDEKGVLRALIAGIFANLTVAVAKFTAFMFTGSSAMLAEALHSFADSSNQGLLAFGLKRAKKEATEVHPFGYGKERYFWAFIVALMIFALGGLFAIYEGVHKLSHPEPIKNPIWNFAALGVGFVVEAYALRVAWIEFKEWRTHNPGPLLQGLRDTKDPTLPTVLFEDSAALVGLVVAAVGVGAATLTGDPTWDAVATIVIGAVLLGVSWFLAIESHSLLVGEGASLRSQDEIRKAVESELTVESIVELLTLQRGPSDLVVAVTVDFADSLRTGGIEDAVHRIETAIRKKVPEASHIFIEAGSLRVSDR